MNLRLGHLVLSLLNLIDNLDNFLLHLFKNVLCISLRLLELCGEILEIGILEDKSLNVCECSSLITLLMHIAILWVLYVIIFQDADEVVHRVKTQSCRVSLRALDQHLQPQRSSLDIIIHLLPLEYLIHDLIVSLDDLYLKLVAGRSLLYLLKVAIVDEVAAHRTVDLVEVIDGLLGQYFLEVTRLECLGGEDVLYDVEGGDDDLVSSVAICIGFNV